MLRVARENFVFLRFQRKSRLANLLSVDCVRSRAPIISRRRGKSLGNLINTKFLAQLGGWKEVGDGISRKFRLKITIQSGIS